MNLSKLLSGVVCGNGFYLDGDVVDGTSGVKRKADGVNEKQKYLKVDEILMDRDVEFLVDLNDESLFFVFELLSIKDLGCLMRSGNKGLSECIKSYVGIYRWRLFLEELEEGRVDLRVLRGTGEHLIYKACEGMKGSAIKGIEKWGQDSLGKGNWSDEFKVIFGAFIKEAKRDVDVMNIENLNFNVYRVLTGVECNRELRLLVLVYLVGFIGGLGINFEINEPEDIRKWNDIFERLFGYICVIFILDKISYVDCDFLLNIIIGKWKKGEVLRDDRNVYLGFIGNWVRGLIGGKRSPFLGELMSSACEWVDERGRMESGENEEAVLERKWEFFSGFSVFFEVIVDVVLMGNVKLEVFWDKNELRGILDFLSKFINEAKGCIVSNWYEGLGDDRKEEVRDVVSCYDDLLQSLLIRGDFGVCEEGSDMVNFKVRDGSWLLERHEGEEWREFDGIYVDLYLSLRELHKKLGVKMRFSGSLMEVFRNLREEGLNNGGDVDFQEKVVWYCNEFYRWVGSCVHEKTWDENLMIRVDAKGMSELLVECGEYCKYMVGEFMEGEDEEGILENCNELLGVVLTVMERISEWDSEGTVGIDDELKGILVELRRYSLSKVLSVGNVAKLEIMEGVANYELEGSEEEEGEESELERLDEEDMSSDVEEGSSEAEWEEEEGDVMETGEDI